MKNIIKLLSCALLLSTSNTTLMSAQVRVAHNQPVYSPLIDLIEFWGMGDKPTSLFPPDLKTEVEKLINEGVDINKLSITGESALLVATQQKYWDIAKLLIDKGADVNVQDQNGNTALLEASWPMGKMDVFDALIKAGADVNAATEEGQTPLMRAASNGVLEKVQKLLKAGADKTINAKDKSGETALSKASSNDDNLDVVNVLINARADVNLHDKFGYSPLWVAAHSQYPTPNIIDALIDAGADQMGKNYRAMGAKALKQKSRAKKK